jgi:hypothetical protein
MIPDTRADWAMELVASLDPDCRNPRLWARGVAPDDERTRVRSWLASPGYAAYVNTVCQLSTLDDNQLVRLNQWLLAATVIMATLAARFLTSSWTVTMIVAAVLMSRGRLLADIGSIAATSLTTLIVTTWWAANLHYLRTGSLVSMSAAIAAAALSLFFEPALAVLLVVVPVLLAAGYIYRKRLAKPVIRRWRAVTRRLETFYAQYHQAGEYGDTWELAGERARGRFTATARWMLGLEFPPPAPLDMKATYQRGSLFRTLSAPYLLWAYAHKHWVKDSAVWIGGGVAAALAWYAVAKWRFDIVSYDYLKQALAAGPWSGTAASWQAWQTGWAQAQLSMIDLHLGTSIAILVVCALQSPAAGLTSFLEAAWLTLMAVLFVLLGGWFADVVDVAWLKVAGGADAYISTPAVRRPLAWFEPVLLSCGVAGLYNLMKVLDTRFADPK